MALCYAWQPWETRRAHSIYPVPFLNLLHIRLCVLAPSKPSSVQRGEHFIRTGKGREERALFLLYGHDPKGPRTKLPTKQAGLPWLPAEKFTTTHVPSRHSALGEQRLRWLENGKEKWEFLQAAKQQARWDAIQVGGTGRTGSRLWGPAEQ